jgi:hypothetical protein
MRNESFASGVSDGMVKVAVRADVSEVVYEAITGQLRPGLSPSPGDDLDMLMPEDGQLEKLLLFLEDRFDVSFGDKVMTRLFADGTVDDLVSAIVTALPEKNAAYSHQHYMLRREHHKQRSRGYRMANAVQLRRKAKAYRRKVARGTVRPRRRVGSAGSGYKFMMR